MKAIRSVVVAFDGESKCGKTTVIRSVAEEAASLHDMLPRTLDDLGGLIDDTKRKMVMDLHTALTFDNISTISAGNAFEGAYDRLQNDPAIGRRISHVAKMSGAQALCGAVFCDSVVEAYHADNGANLVIVDARNPIDMLHRNHAIGTDPAQILPRTILPIYIDTPPEVAAGRLKGDLTRNLEEISHRRWLDVTRTEAPFVVPCSLYDNFDAWSGQFEGATPDLGVAMPYHLRNGEGMSLDDIQSLSGVIACLAHNVALEMGPGLPESLIPPREM